MDTQVAQQYFSYTLIMTIGGFSDECKYILFGSLIIVSWKKICRILKNDDCLVYCAIDLIITFKFNMEFQGVF